MELSSQAHMALRLVLDLALHGQGRIREIGARQGIPAPYLAKIVQALARAGVVKTSRGVHGGVRLSRPAERITLREVVEAAEGPVALNRCVQWENCACVQPCPVRAALAMLQHTVVTYLDSITLDTMARGLAARPARPGRALPGSLSQAPEA